MKRATRAIYFAIACLTALALLSAHAGTASSANGAPPAQDLMSLDRRINTLEQHLFQMESNINQLQQRVQYAQRQPATTAPPDPQVERLRLELSLLQERLGEVECGLLKLDERTLPAAARAQQSKPADPCRSQPNTHVRLSSRRQ